MTATRNIDSPPATRLPSDLEQSLIESLCHAILDEVQANRFLRGCQSFVELHDHCDANMLGGQALVFHWLTAEQSHRIINAAQAEVESFLKMEKRGDE